MMHRLAFRFLKTPTYQQYAHFVRGFKGRSKSGAKTSSLVDRIRTAVASEKNTKPLSKTGYGLLVRPVGFTVLVAGLSTSVCGIWEYESLKSELQNWTHERRVDALRGKAGSWREKTNSWWQNLRPGERLVAGIIAANTLVFLAWRVPALGGIMPKYFMANILQKSRCIPMVLANWSHVNIWHLFMNMYVLWSFRNMADSIGKEKFMAFTTTAGVFAILTHYVGSYYTGMHNIVGASGWILALLGYCAVQYPDLRLQIVLVDQIFPQHAFSIRNVAMSLIAVDSLGVLLRWSVVAHAGHLGGMFFGLWFGAYGDKLWNMREPVVRLWHSLRKDS